MVSFNIFVLGAGVSAVDVHPHKAAVQSIDHVVVGLVHSFKSDCWKKRPVALMQHASNVTKVGNPGAGMNPDEIEPFTTVLKDGYMLTDCVKDAMYEHGDKHGNNAASYKMGSVAGVSIVHYSEIVDKIDQEEMSHQVCFEFCRTVPDMTFFGINNGNDCYCTPYYKPMAGSSDECDVPCPGEPYQMCGGKSKSSVFSMHMCADTANDLETALGTAGELLTSLDDLTANMKEIAEVGQADANLFQDSFGAVGDPAVSDLMQAAKVWAGDLLHAAEGGVDLSDKLKSTKDEGDALKGNDFTDYEKSKEAEDVIKVLQRSTSTGETSLEELTEMLELAHPSAEEGEYAAAQYYPVMYFVDRQFEPVPQTCGGQTIAKPIFGKSKDECATACDALAGECVAFSFFEKDSSVCFLFDKLTSVQYYTGCVADDVFLQTSQKIRKEAPYTATCVAKLSSFEGTTLKPDRSGKCDACLKEVTKANRCFK